MISIPADRSILKNGLEIAPQIRVSIFRPLIRNDLRDKFNSSRKIWKRDVSPFSPNSTINNLEAVSNNGEILSPHMGIAILIVSRSKPGNCQLRVVLSVVSNQQSGFKKIGFVTGAGNSNSPKNYSFMDQPTDGTKFSYRLKQIDYDGNYKYYDAITITLTESQTAELMQNSPNPFNPSTAIRFFVPNNSFVSIKIYDMLGKEVTTLINGQTNAGYHIVYWAGKDKFGNDVSSGVYLYRLTAGSFNETKKMLMMK